MSKVRERGAPRFVQAAILLPLLGFIVANCSGKRSASDDDDTSGRAGAAGATNGGKAGSGSGATSSGGSAGSSETGGSGGSAAASTGGVAGDSSASGGTDGGDGGEPNTRGGSGGGDDGGTGGDATGGTSGADGKGGSAGKGGDGGNGATSGSAGTNSNPPVCGNGLTEGSEGCDDLNTDDGDGCDADCEVEPGNVCTQADCVDFLCTYSIPATFRDFNAHAAPGGHPDFDPGFNSPGATQGLLSPTLDSEGKPVLVGPNTNAFMHGVSDFAKWYRNTQGTNVAIAGSVVLHGGAGGGFSNRWGENGEEWRGQSAYGNVVAGGPGTAGGAPGCTLAACDGRPCYDPCTPWGAGVTLACCADNITQQYEGTPLFFPIDSAPGILDEPRFAGKVPEQYGWPGWPWESDVATMLGVSTPVDTAFAPFPSPTHNFNFTSELTFRLRYDADVTQAIEIMGDDDIWMFVNGHLAVDLGGWHPPLNGYVSFMGGTVTSYANVDGSPTNPVITTAPDSTFDLVDGEVLTVKIFHAERQKEGSTFKLRVLGFELDRSVCAPP
jgi:fibro-slime domain-containing protein